MQIHAGETGEPTTLEKRLAVRARPSGPAAMYQVWQELLFLHWEVPIDIVQPRLPRGLTVDTFEGRAWIGVVPFFMRRIRPRWSPAIPGISDFQELNCRTYVVDRHGVPGVWFFSLHANVRLAVWWGRTLFQLPYTLAKMSYSWDQTSGQVEFRSRRLGTASSGGCAYVYRPSGRAAPSVPGTLEFFLVERYALFTHRRDGSIARGIVHHAPYEVSSAEVTAYALTPLALNGFRDIARPPDHALVSRGVSVEVFPLHAVP